MRSMSSRFQLFSICLVSAAIAVISAIPGQTMASHSVDNQWQGTAWNDDHVIVFSECGYSGRAKALPRGDYQNTKRIGIDHKAISSIIIPHGMAVEVFQRKQFGGHWYRLNQNQICLKGNWNNKIRSIRILDDNVSNSYGFSQDTHYGSQDRNCHDYTLESKYGEGAVRFVDKGGKLKVVRPGYPVHGSICQKQQLRVELAKKDKNAQVILSIGGQDYQFAQWAQYDNYQDSWYRKYLTIQLPQNGQGHNHNQIGQMQYGKKGWGNTRGFGKRYSSGIPTGQNWGNNYPQNWNKKVVQAQPQPSQPASASCTPYTVSGNHQDTGIRFLVGDSIFVPVGQGSKNGQICHSGNIQVELAKKRPPAEVKLRIGARVFAFRGGDKGSRFVNGWYRKYYTIQLH